MKLLLDTCAFLWAATEPSSLSAVARRAVSDARNERLLSAASAWEIAIKTRMGRIALKSPADRFVPEQLAALVVGPLPVSHEHALRTSRLPLHHRDPFDRLLIAQAQSERVAIVTPDAAFKAYGVDIVW